MPKVHFMNKKKDAVQDSLKILKTHSANWKYKFSKQFFFVFFYQCALIFEEL